MKHKIKIGYLISYDYNLLYESLKIVYDYADEIFLAIDRDRMTWAGQRFELGEDFFEVIKQIDVRKKIKVYEDNFYIEKLSPIENETRERNMLSKKMGPNCWKLQIDADEYFVNFDQVYKFLRKHRYFLYKSKHNPINIRAKWITLFKKVPNGFLYIDNNEHFSFATNFTEPYVLARNPQLVPHREIFTDFVVAHQSWARDASEILQKISNWGHKNDFDSDKFINLWESVNESNYNNFTNFHPITPTDWSSLKFMPCSDIKDFISKYNSVTSAPADPILPRKFRKIAIKNMLKFYKL